MEIQINRVLDANFNRSREALRVMEEFMRFVLDDASLTQALKSARHDLTDAIRGLPNAAKKGGQDRPHIKEPTGLSGVPEGPRSIATGRAQRHPWLTDPDNPTAPAGAEELDLALFRDTPGDVGTSISTPAEFNRSNASDVVAAAGKRLSESLRVLEEYGKTIDPNFALAIEQLRYRAYDLERRIFATIHAGQKFSAVRLYILISESLCAGDWFETARAALDGGADCLQLREKELPGRELLNRAKRLAQLCRDMEKIFIVNDRPDIALAANAHGVHLGQDDMPIAVARRLLPAWMIVGLSTHTIEQVDLAIAQAPDYIALGPMFDSATKPQDQIAGPELLADAGKRTALPLVAIGGIDQTNVSRVLAAGPVCACVCSAVISHPDPGAATRELLQKLESFSK